MMMSSHKNSNSNKEEAQSVQSTSTSKWCTLSNVSTAEWSTTLVRNEERQSNQCAPLGRRSLSIAVRGRAYIEQGSCYGGHAIKTAYCREV
jgi:hypothetical protein